MKSPLIYHAILASMMMAEVIVNVERPVLKLNHPKKIYESTMIAKTNVTRNMVMIRCMQKWDLTLPTKDLVCAVKKVLTAWCFLRVG